MPDYLFFRTHKHKLYREFRGFPRYSVISRKFTDDFSSLSTEFDSSLETLFVCDGTTAQNTSQFFFQIAKELDLSIIGTNLDFTELPKLRYQIPPDIDFEEYSVYSLIAKQSTQPSANQGRDIGTCSSFLPSFCEFSLKRGNGSQKEHKISVGAVKHPKEFFPSYFDILRLNIGDLIEYKQSFTPNWPDMEIDPVELNTLILQEVEKILISFNVKVVFLSFYKLARFYNLLATSKDSSKDFIDMLSHAWKYSESIVVNNKERRIWEEESIMNLNQLFDKHGYIILFNPY